MTSDPGQSSDNSTHTLTTRKKVAIRKGGPGWAWEKSFPRPRRRRAAQAGLHGSWRAQARCGWLSGEPSSWIRRATGRARALCARLALGAPPPSPRMIQQLNADFPGGIHPRGRLPLLRNRRLPPPGCTRRCAPIPGAHWSRDLLPISATRTEPCSPIFPFH